MKKHPVLVPPDDPHRPFVIFSLPRCRSAWLARFLSVQGWFCGHDQAMYFRGMKDVQGWLALANTGTIETGGAPFWRLVGKFAPWAKVGVLRRPVEEVMTSLDRLTPPNKFMEVAKLIKQHDAKLDQILARWPGAQEIHVSDLDHEGSSNQIFEWATGTSAPAGWWNFLHKVNIQIDFQFQTRYCAANAWGIEQCRLDARQTMLADLARGLPVSEAFVFQEEDFDSWYKDAQTLFPEHALEAEWKTADWKNIDFALMKDLSQKKLLNIVTARSNGRMFGYHFTVLAPTFAKSGACYAEGNSFYASAEFPGLGRKLLRESIASLRRRGVEKLFMRAGIGGVKPRMGNMYTYMGAKPFGQMFEFDLQGGANG